MPERFLGIQTPHDSGRTGSLPIPTRAPPGPAASELRPHQNQYGIHSGADGWAAITPRSQLVRCPPPQRKGREARARSSQSTPLDVQFLVVPRHECACARSVFPPVRSAQTIEAASSEENLFDPRLVAKLRLPHRPRRDHRPSFRLGGPLPPAVPDAPARRPE
jgi:hypothetical protein